ncbi:MAG: NADH-quinone oxidoreductase subunit I [Planctomycetota bacterium]|jgi:NADH-quinone oxidoreductase subunit I|nr:NADH-quinone oxidoreductase subunit I [Planctomycetota bacterium]
MTTKSKREKTVKWGEEPKIGWMEAMYLPAVMSGVATAVRHALSGKPMTRQYPEVEPEIPANYRGVHRLNRDEEGRVKCVACYMCQTACPANCIEIIAAPAPKDDPHWENRDKYPATFTIDELRCIYCGMCEEACPVDAIELTSIYDLTGMTREEMIFDKEKLLSVFDKTIQTGQDPVRTNRGALGPASEEAETAKQGPPPPGRGRKG